MDEDKAGPAASSRVSAAAAAPPPQPPSSSSAKDSKEALSSAKRQMFAVELKPEETTIVSWKKLLKEAGRGSARPNDSAGVPAAGPASAAV